MGVYIKLDDFDTKLDWLSVLVAAFYAKLDEFYINLDGFCTKSDWLYTRLAGLITLTGGYFIKLGKYYTLPPKPSNN